MPVLHFHLAMGSGIQDDGFMVLAWSDYVNLFDTVLVAKLPG